MLWCVLSWFLFGKCLLVFVIWWFGFWFVASFGLVVTRLCWLYSACGFAVLLQVGLRLGFGGWLLVAAWLLWCRFAALLIASGCGFAD